jgi:hypothetical protein
MTDGDTAIGRDHCSSDPGGAIVTSEPTPGWLPVIREVVAGVLSLIVISAFVVLLTRALERTAKPDEFGPVKDLLGMITPIAGLVIGYYFSRVTSEARAERAEAAVVVHSRSASDAIAAQHDAEAHARTASGALAELSSAAEAIKPAASLESVQAGETGTARARFDLALARAQEALRN